MSIYPSWLEEHKKDLYNLDDTTLLAACIYGEAATESDEGKLGVACVVRNRVKRRGWWGSTYKHVILAKKQFSCFNSNDPMLMRIRRVINKPNDIFKICYNIAKQVICEEANDITGGATHYFNPSIVKPRWSKNMIRTCRIGNHDFYNGYI